MRAPIMTAAVVCFNIWNMRFFSILNHSFDFLYITQTLTIPEIAVLIAAPFSWNNFIKIVFNMMLATTDDIAATRGVLEFFCANKMADRIFDKTYAGRPIANILKMQAVFSTSTSENLPWP
ncbi:hypothetical protein FACS1894113_5170 [Alphaproteobacteria bacterium]|nr:hypothetical protein FACS1894113_5170 [Alphaproteobacteria bacterium]